MTRHILAVTFAATLMGGCAGVMTQRHQVTFRTYVLQEEVESLAVAGNFNGWDPAADPMTDEDSDGIWEATVELPSGRHPYKFVRDGEEWWNDPWNPRVEPFGSGNSILYLGVDPQDFPADHAPLIAERRTWLADMGGMTTAERGAVTLLGDAIADSARVLPARPVHVWLPPGYHQSPGRRYPVLYMLDGQNAFDDPERPNGQGGWHVNVEAERLIAEGRIEPFIVVAIPNGPARMSEYGTGHDVLNASAHPLSRYLIDDVMPRVNGAHRTRLGPRHTAVMGSSAGGHAAFLLAHHHPDVIGAAACLSSAFVMIDPSGMDVYDLVRVRGRRPVRFYLDSGTEFRFGDFADHTARMRDLLAERGWRIGDDLVWHLEEGAPHSEGAWRDRLWRPLEFLFGVE